MPSSGSVDFSVSRDDLITQALQDLGIMSALDTTSSTTFTDNSTMAAIKLNMIVKQLAGSADFSQGIKMWSRKRGYLFLQTTQPNYTLGPTTTQTGTNNKWASSYLQTTLSVNAAVSAGTVTVTTVTGIATTNRIGIQLNSGAIQWTTVNGAPAGSVVTLTDVLTGAANSGNIVYVYATTAQARRPLSILTGVLRDTATNDIELHPMLLPDYEAIPSKLAAGTPSQYYYEATLLDGNVYFDRAPSVVSQVARFVYLSTIEDFDASADTPDYDQNWYLPLSLSLQYQLAPTFGRHDLMPAIKTLRDEALLIAKNSIPETSDAFYQPDAPL